MLKKFKKDILFYLIFTITFSITGCNNSSKKYEETETTTISNRRNNNYTSINNNSNYNWALENIEPSDKKPYTILIYMNGTDLESEYGCATLDIEEMINSKFDVNNINLLLLTGGTSTWHNNIITNDTMIYQVVDDTLVELMNFGNASIADINLLSTYIDFGMSAYPADKYGFIFWNHGGGTIYGYGADENYEGASLSIKQIGESFKNSIASETPFEFIGYDCCLMATMETAYEMSPYTHYLIASEELEPSFGWDYNWLDELSNNPNYSGEEIGNVIVDKFVDFYESSGEEATLSLIDLDKIEPLMTSFDKFSAVADKALQQGNYNLISKARRGTKSFGYNGEGESNFDLVDIKHLAKKLSESFPNEANNIISSVDDCVVYYRNSSNVKNSYGVSTYIPYSTKETAKDNITIYKQLNILPQFTKFLDDFTNKLTAKKVERSNISKLKPVQTNKDISIKLDNETLKEINKIRLTVWRELEKDSNYFINLGVYSNVNIAEDGTIKIDFDGHWATLGGQIACFYEIEHSDGIVKYCTPAILNGEKVGIIFIYDEKNSEGKIVGAIPQGPKNSNMAAKTVIPIKKGDKILLKYYAHLFSANGLNTEESTEINKWVDGEEFTVSDNFKVEIVPIDDKLYLYNFWIEDTQNNSYYTDFIEFRY